MSTNTTAEKIYFGMREMVRHRSHDLEPRREIHWAGLICVYYPMSDTFNWFSTKVRDTLTKPQVISLINIHLGDEA